MRLILVTLTLSVATLTLSANATSRSQVVDDMSPSGTRLRLQQPITYYFHDFPPTTVITFPQPKTTVRREGGSLIVRGATTDRPDACW